MKRVLHKVWRWLIGIDAFVALWRRLMFRTTVIAITGSVGKTTAKEALAAILGAQGATHKTANNNNSQDGVRVTLGRMRPWHRYAVVEIGTGSPGHVRFGARLVRPDVAVVLCVARQHTRRFDDLDATAGEKASLLEFLTRDGVAVLNADDPRVRAMAPPAGRRTVWFGWGAEAEVRGVSASGAWPERLSVTVEQAGQQATADTALVGRHWAPSLLAAIAAAHVLGVPIAESASALRGLRPFSARLQPLMLPNGAVVLRDEYNGSPHTLDVMLEVMREARARRRVLVFSDVSDSREQPRKRLRAIGKVAAELADAAIFVGGHAHHAVKAACNAGMDTAHCHDAADVQTAAELLRAELRPGDLVFLKGRMTDHLSRIAFAQFGSIGCRRNTCGVRDPCEFCRRLKPGYDIAAAIEHGEQGATVLAEP